MIMSIRLLSSAILALTVLTPVAYAQSVPADPVQTLNCKQRDIGVKGDCIDPTSAKPENFLGVIADTKDITNGNGGWQAKSSKYRIIYESNPLLTINNNPK
jgi:hypothetical protein